MKAVIFDLDGTLVDSMWIWEAIDIAYLQRHGYPLPEDLQKEIEGMSFTETASYFKARFNIPDDLDTIKAEWVAMAEDYYANKIPLKAGARTFIEQLKKAGIPVGIGTSNSRELALMSIRNHQLEPLIDTLITSCEVEKGKPAPDVFLKAAEQLGVSPEDCLVFEDTYAGVQAALNAGMQVVGIKDETSLPWAGEIEPLVTFYADDFSGMWERIS